MLEHPLFWNAEERLKLIDDVKEAFGGASQLRNAIDERPVPGQRTIDGWDYKKHWWFRNSRDWRLKNGIAAKVFWDASPVRGEAVKFVHPTGSRLYGKRSVSAGPTAHVVCVAIDSVLRSTRRCLCGQSSFLRLSTL